MKFPSSAGGACYIFIGLAAIALSGCSKGGGSSTPPPEDPVTAPSTPGQPIPAPESTAPAPIPAPEPAPAAPTPIHTPVPQPTPSQGPAFPRLMGMNIGGKNYDDSAYQAAMSRYHYVIMGFYPGWKANYSYGGYTGIRAAVKALKDRNPNLLIGQYTILNEAQPASDPNNAANADISTKLDQMNWWLRTASGDLTQWTSSFNAYDINFTAYTPTDSQGLRWPEWRATRDYTKYFQPIPEFDIHYLDNVFEKNRVTTADWTLDGVDDSNGTTAMISAHRNGHVAEWNKIRQLKSSLMLIGNTDHDLSMPEYKGQLEGGFLEGMMGKSWSIYGWGGWDKMMARYHGVMANTKAPHLVGFNVMGALTDYRLMRFGLTATLMNDGYYYYTDTAKEYSSAPWFDEYGAALGYPSEGPRTAAWSNGVYRRLFSNGMVLVNPTNASVTVNIGNGYKRISGTQDPGVNNGQVIVGNITIPATDGVVLLKK